MYVDSGDLLSKLCGHAQFLKYEASKQTKRNSNKCLPTSNIHFENPLWHFTVTCFAPSGFTSDCIQGAFLCKPIGNSSNINENCPLLKRKHDSQAVVGYVTGPCRLGKWRSGDKCCTPELTPPPQSDTHHISRYPVSIKIFKSAMPFWGKWRNRHW